MKRLLQIVLIMGVLAACTPASTPKNSEFSQVGGPRDKVCEPPRDINAEGAAMRERLGVLAERLRSGKADPARDAAEAAKRGQFGLIRASTMMGLFPMGVSCRLPTDNVSAPPMTLVSRFVSDVPGSCATFGGKDACDLERTLDHYGVSYNRALVANPLYPFRDLCRVSDGKPEQVINDPVEYGYRDEPLTDRPHDLYEAARRGTPKALADLIARYPESIDVSDAYGMTPLAWSVAYGRTDTALKLMAAGAKPQGIVCPPAVGKVTPVRIALATGQSKLAEEMLAPQYTFDFSPWPRELITAAAEGNLSSIFRRMLTEPHEPFNLDQRHGGSADAAILKTDAEYRSSLCWTKPLPVGTRVRMVGTYESPEHIAMPFGNRPGRVNLKLDDHLHPTLLVLTAYEPVEWRIARSKGSRLVGISFSVSIRKEQGVILAPRLLYPIMATAVGCLMA